MTLNSLSFLLFFAGVFAAYWFLSFRRVRLQNLLLLTASLVFYGWADWRFLLLITFSSFLDYAVARGIGGSGKQWKRNLLLTLSIFINLGVLLFFKYFNFFVISFTDFFNALGFSVRPVILQILLPLGISYYTFKTMSYVIDVYRDQMKPVRDIMVYLNYTTFFPQIIAGPIERASVLIPQFSRTRVFNYSLASDGARQVLWGLFKKIVVADTLALFADPVFMNPSHHHFITLAFALLYFAFQVYCDFSGYSDISIGVSKMLGFNIMPNFAYPYFSRNVSEFWRRWHISLSSWLRDYIFSPLVVRLRNMGRAGTAIAVMITFTLCGFWHGPSWNYIIWGALNGLFILPVVLFNLNDSKKIVAWNHRFPHLKEVLQIMLTFALVSIAWVFFRTSTLSAAATFFKSMFTHIVLSRPDISVRGFYLIAFILAAEWIMRRKEFAFQIQNLNVLLRWSFYLMISLMIIGFYSEGKSFIYFQF